MTKADLVLQLSRLPNFTWNFGQLPSVLLRFVGAWGRVLGIADSTESIFKKSDSFSATVANRDSFPYSLCCHDKKALTIPIAQISADQLKPTKAERYRLRYLSPTNNEHLLANRIKIDQFRDKQVTQAIAPNQLIGHEKIFPQSKINKQRTQNTHFIKVITTFKQIYLQRIIAEKRKNHYKIIQPGSLCYPTPKLSTA
ncbi:hypothetical protein [Pseudomonas sp. NyZ201]|uniref:hypothetical protein n=1 Tax=Pseudomonas sp. NyZ201 TaxID=3409857 RepID=UPI003CE78364